MDERSSARPELAPASAARATPPEKPVRPEPLTPAPADSKHGLRARIARAAQSSARTGVSLPLSVFLVALAALQGLLVVAALSFMHNARVRTALVRAPSHESSASARLSAPARKAPPDSAASVAAVVGGAAPAPSRVETQPTAPGVPSAESGPFAESGPRAPSCDQLLAGAATNDGAYPDAAYAQMREANRALVRGNVDAAQRSLCKAALWDQSNPAIPLEVAQLMLLRRDGASAVDWARKGIRLAPSDLRAQGILGDGLARLGDYDAAKRAWLKALKLEDASEAQVKALSFASSGEAQASLARKDFARAERFFRRAVVLDSDNAQAAHGLANALFRLGDVSSALSWAKHAVSLAPRDPAARVLLGDILLQNGERTAAEAEWREALHIDPSSFVAQLHLNKLHDSR